MVISVKKKVSPLSVIIYIIAIAGIAVGGFCIFINKLPEGLIVIGCSVILSVLPSLLKPGSFDAADDSLDEDGPVVFTAKEIKNAAVICSYVGRCRIGDAQSMDCTLRITETSVEFLTAKGKIIIAPLRMDIDNVEVVNCHTVVMTVKGDDKCKFVCNDTSAITSIHQVLSRTA